MSKEAEAKQDGGPAATTPANVDRRNRLLVTGAWAAFGLGVLVLAAMSLRACDLGVLRGLFSRHCDIEVAVAPPNNLVDEIRSLERELARSPDCAPPLQAQATPPPPPPPPVSCPEPPPEEVVLSVDLSLSMENCLDTSLESERQLDRLYQASNGTYNIWQRAQYQSQIAALEQSMRCSSPRRRIDFAKKALIDLANSTRSEASFVLQSFSSCERSAATHGRYSSADRSRMTGEINNMRTGPSTNLSNAILSAAAQLRGGRSPDQPANIVVVSDGQDSCGGDPCAAARRVKQSHPYAKIHVITVGGDVAVGQCIAAATGGRVFEARNASKLADAIQEASGANIPEVCRSR